MQLATTGSSGQPAQDDYELAVRDANTGSTKLLGHRDFARYYRQRPHTSDARASVAANAIVARYGQLSCLTRTV